MALRRHIVKSNVLGTFGVALLVLIIGGALILSDRKTAQVAIDTLAESAANRIPTTGNVPLQEVAHEARARRKDEAPVQEGQTTQENLEIDTVAFGLNSDRRINQVTSITLDLRLVGLDTFAASPQFIVENQTTGEQQVVSRNGRVFDVATVIDVVPNGVELQMDSGERKRLFLQSGAAGSGRGSKEASIDVLTGSDMVAKRAEMPFAPLQDSSTKQPMQISEFTFDDVQEIASHPGAVISETAPVLAYRDGKYLGVQFSMVDNGTVAQRAGFKSGDIVLAVEGTRVRDPYDIAKMLLQVRKPSAKITIERDGKQMDILTVNNMKR